MPWSRGRIRNGHPRYHPLQCLVKNSLLSSSFILYSLALFSPLLFLLISLPNCNAMNNLGDANGRLSDRDIDLLRHRVNVLSFVDSRLADLNYEPNTDFERHQYETKTRHQKYRGQKANISWQTISWSSKARRVWFEHLDFSDRKRVLMKNACYGLESFMICNSLSHKTTVYFLNSNGDSTEQVIESKACMDNAVVEFSEIQLNDPLAPAAFFTHNDNVNRHGAYEYRTRGSICVMEIGFDTYHINIRPPLLNHELTLASSTKSAQRTLNSIGYLTIDAITESERSMYKETILSRDKLWNVWNFHPADFPLSKFHHLLNGLFQEYTLDILEKEATTITRRKFQWKVVRETGIPKIIHFVILGNELLSNENMHALISVTNVHHEDDYAFYLWYDADTLDTLGHNMLSFLNFMQGKQFYLKKVDYETVPWTESPIYEYARYHLGLTSLATEIIKAHALSTYGGIYVHQNVFAIESYEEFLRHSNIKFFLTHDRFQRTGTSGLNTMVMGSTKSHPLLQKLVTRISENLNTIEFLHILYTSATALAETNTTSITSPESSLYNQLLKYTLYNLAGPATLSQTIHSYIQSKTPFSLHKTGVAFLPTTYLLGDFCRNIFLQDIYAHVSANADIENMCLFPNTLSYTFLNRDAFTTSMPVIKDITKVRVDVSEEMFEDYEPWDIDMDMFLDDNDNWSDLKRGKGMEAYVSGVGYKDRKRGNVNTFLEFFNFGAT